jgi:hypothetical protein
MRGFVRTLFRGLVSLALIAGVALAGFALWRGAGPLPDPERCRVALGGHIVGLDPDQGQLAALISGIAVRRGLPARAASIALATAYQESKIRNLDHGDRDSLGIFQQRPSQGWGTAAQIRDPHYATNAFYDALEKIDGYQDMRITEAAQRVQRSGFPEAYEDHAADARALASSLSGFSEEKFSCVVHQTEDRGTRRAVLAELRRTFGPLPTANRARQDVAISVGTGEAEVRRGWAIAQFLVGYAREHHIRSVSFDGRRWDQGKKSEDGWQPAGKAGSREIVVSMD